ncbi:hypothetical protein Taro_014728, partial [Colocasia esculenta]|nr:hypothetical protein [Colocasia esculenta]
FSSSSAIVFPTLSSGGPFGSGPNRITPPQYCRPVVILKWARPSTDVDALVREILCEENAIFLAIDEAIADEIFESNEEHSVPRPMHISSHSGHDAIGAIDGTHVPAHILREKQARYRNCKGVVSQNVMGVCGFDLVFQYVGVGFEGAITDMAVLRRAMDVGGFHVL